MTITRSIAMYLYTFSNITRTVVEGKSLIMVDIELRINHSSKANQMERNIAEMGILVN